MAVVCLFLFNDIAFAQPSSSATLAPELKLKPFFENHESDFQTSAAVMWAAGQLRDLIAAGEVRQSHIVRLNKLFTSGQVDIEKGVKDAVLSTGRPYKYAIFNLKKEDKSVEVRFVRDCDNFTKSEQGELGFPLLRGVWFASTSRPAILGGRPAFKEKIDMIKPTDPTNTREVLKVIGNIVKHGMYNIGYGFKAKFVDILTQHLKPGDKKVIAVSSGTEALMLLLMGAKVGEDGRNEVIVPSFTFHATIRAILRCGLKPVFVDIDPNTLNVDPKKVEETISEKTGAIMPVDVFGNPADCEKLEMIARKYNLKLLIDSAGSLGSTYKGRPTGNFGDGAAFSLSFGKIVQAFGRGGVVVVPQDILTELNNDRRGFLAASMMTEVNAVVAYDNMLSLEKHVKARQRIADIYEDMLKDVPGITLQRLTGNSTSTYTHFPLIINEKLFGMNRDDLKWAMASEGIQTKEYFPAQHRFFTEYRQGELSNTEKISDSVLCLPVWSDMSDETATRIAEAVKKIYANRKEISEVFSRRRHALKGFINLGDGPFTIERDLLFRRPHLLVSMLRNGVLPPTEVEFEPSNVCNNKCRSCIGRLVSREGKVRPMIMSKEEGLKILRDIKEYNDSLPKELIEDRVRLIRFSGCNGEPLTSPATLATMKQAVEWGFDISLVTNGRLLNKEARDVVVKGKYVYISLYGGSPESYDAITHAGTNVFEEVLHNIEELTRLKKEKEANLEIGVGFLIQPETYREVVSVAERIKKAGASYIRFRAVMEDKQAVLSPDQLKECYENLRLAKERFEDENFKVVIMYGEEEAKELVKRPFARCFAHPLIAIVGPDSSLYPCAHTSCVGQKSYGELKKNSFMKIWRGPGRMNFMSRLVPAKQCPICPPQAGRVNAFLEFIAAENESDPAFMDWLQDWKAHAVANTTYLVKLDPGTVFRLKYPVKKNGNDSNGIIPRSTSSAPPAADVMQATLGMAQAEADKIHTENLKADHMPAIPEKTILCHIVAESILSDGQRGMLKTLEQEMRHEKYSEKVVSFSIPGSASPEEFTAKLGTLKTQIENQYQGYKVQFDVACPRQELVEKIQSIGIQALAFGREGEGDIVQIEGIILALRALKTGNASDLINIYEFLTGKDYITDKTDINELAKIMLFILPVRKVDVNQISTINRIIEENIKSAA